MYCCFYYISLKKKRKKKKKRKDNVLLLPAHCTYGPYIAFSQIHFVQLEPLNWGAKSVTIKCNKLATDKGTILTLFLVDSILSH